MIKSFDQYLNEALSLKRSDRGAHFLERAEQRLNGLTVVGIIPDGGKAITKVDPKISKDIEYFFRNTLTALADPNESLLFRETNIEPTKIGLVLMARPRVVLPDGTGATPVFSVYERMDNGRAVNREGSYFWIITIGSETQTILLHQHDGRKESQRESLIERSIKHITQSREAELARMSRISGIDFNLESEIKAAHEVITRTIGGGRLELDLTRPESIEQLTTDSISNLTVNREQPVIQDIEDRGDFEFRLERSSKQMTVSPRNWFMERNEAFGAWGAMPILSSKLVKGVTGNEIWLEVGDKWVYWVKKQGETKPMPPFFNPPKPSSQRIITKGDKVSIAKEVGGGNFLINTGIVSEISMDPRSSEYPYFKTEKWISNEVIAPDEAQNIFRRKGAIVENKALTFSEFISL